MLKECVQNVIGLKEEINLLGYVNMINYMPKVYANLVTFQNIANYTEENDIINYYYYII